MMDVFIVPGTIEAITRNADVRTAWLSASSFALKNWIIQNIPIFYFLRITHAYRCPQAREKKTVIQEDHAPNAIDQKKVRLSHNLFPLHPPPSHNIISIEEKKRNHKAIPTRLPSLPATISSSTGVSGVIIKLLLYRFEVVGEDSRVYKTESRAVVEELVERSLGF